MEANSFLPGQDVPWILDSPKVHWYFSKELVTGLNPQSDESIPQSPTLFI